MTVNCPESPETIMKDMREIGPSFLLCPPRVWESILAEVQVKIEDSDWLKRSLFNYFMKVAHDVIERKMEGNGAGFGLSLMYNLGRFFIYSPLRDQLGMRKVRIAYTGGAALGPDIFKLYRSLGINYKQLYGLTEVSALATYQPDDEASPETVGKAIPGVEIKLSEGGEVLLKAPGVFQGYYKNSEATSETLKDGWLHTGDAGFLDKNNHLVIIDRAKDVSSLSDGTMFSPQYIENKLKFSPYIREAVAIGRDRPYVAAIINIDPGNTGNWAERKGLSYTSYMELAQKPEVYDLIQEQITEVNKSLAADPQTKKTQIKKFLILHKELDADDAEITRTRKIRRGFIAEKYADMIDAFYSDKEQISVTAKITYEDGREASTESSLRICHLAEVGELTATGT
jgi:long-chain acyl-CoA synthetase